MTKWLTPWQNLDPVFASAVIKGLATLEHDNVPVVIPKDGGKRSDAMQIALGAQGRQSLDVVNLLRHKAGMPPIDDSDNKYTVTNCDGIHKKSPHQKGVAVDIVPQNSNGDPCWPPPDDSRWKVIRSAMVAQGLESGQDWVKFPDYPHYQKKGV